MGIDIYARWEGQTKEEEEAQFTGFSVTSGHVGYLREAYHGSPYATHILVAEAFEAEECEAQIPAEVLESRLEETLKAVRERERVVYDSEDSAPVEKSFRDFVALCKRKEEETGQPVTIIASY